MLQDFTEKKMVPDEAKKYLENVVNKEMPRGLKQYMEVSSFPAFIWSLAEAFHCVLHNDGFILKASRYIEHKKSLYYDGHERPDVVKYRQEEFLPAMERYRTWLVEYTVGNIAEEVVKDYSGEQKLVLVAHDEMTAQANDGRTKSWVLDGEQPLKKKGIGHGIHQSDVICSTFGWIEEASQSMEYAKNYEGYWDGELFVKQVE